MFNYQTVINGDAMNKIFAIVFNLAIFLMLFSVVNACKSPVLYNNYSVPISLYGGMLEITYSDYAPDAVMVDYTLSVKNTNNQGLTINFTPSSALFNAVFPTSISLGANEQKDVKLQVNVGGTNKYGELYVDGKCADTSPISEGTIYVSVEGRGSVVSCKGTPQSCGMPGQCEDVTKSDGCSDGYFRHYSCENNKKTLAYSMCTSTCCSSVGGTCKGSPSICSVPHFSVNLPLNITNETGKPKSVTITLYEPGTTKVVNTTTINGYGVISSPNATVDFNLGYDSSILNILFRNLDLTKLTSTLKFTLDDVSTTIPDANLIKAYAISTSLTSFDGSLKFKYSGLSYNNEQALAIYKCSSFNKTSHTCNVNWVKQSTTKDTVSDIASTEITGFSAYAFAESTLVTTTTTTTTTVTETTQSSSSGSSNNGGGRVTTTTKPITASTIVTQCTCESWSNVGCGTDPCDKTQMKQQRACDPTGCDMESQCASDDSCIAVDQETNKTENLATSKQTGLFVLPNLSQYAYPILGIILLGGAGVTIWKFNGRIRGFSVSKSSTKGYAFTRIEKPSYVEVKMVEKPKVEVKPVEQVKEKLNSEARNRSYEEMRKRALEMDKKIKRK